MSEASFTFNGQTVPYRAGQSLAAALTDAGIRRFRETAKGASRGIFCGMGVCQDCLVTVDGVPNRRACMTRANEAHTVHTQIAFADLGTAKAAPAKAQARTISPDVLVVGGGAGGLSAAIAAARAGASVTVLDERHVAGGQYYKQAANAEPLDQQQQEGADLVAEALRSGAEILRGVEIWGAFDSLLFLAEHAGAALIARPSRAIIATGAYERPRMVPGWTLPGVMTTGAAQTLWRSYRTLPGRRVALCGSGPLNMQVALELAKGGADVPLVAEAGGHPLRHIWAGLNLMAADPGLSLKGLSMLRGLKKRGIPVRNNLTLAGVEQVGDALCATFQASNGAQTQVEVDTLCMNDGFEPQNEILRLLGARMRYDPKFGHLRCQRSETCETTVPGLFAVGDCAGLGGAPAARIEGKIAGLAAATQMGFGDGYDVFADQRSLARHRRFQNWLWRLHVAAPRALTHSPPDTILCRCEELSLGDVIQGMEAEPGHVGTLKRATRVGMGRCQGRYCGPAAARLVAQTTGKQLEDHSHFAPRVPIKPVSIAAILAAQEALDAEG